MTFTDKKLNTANLDTLSATFALSLAETDKLVASWLSPLSTVNEKADETYIGEVSDNEINLELELKSVYSRAGLGSNSSDVYSSSVNTVRNVGSTGGLGSETGEGAGVFANKALDALRRRAEKEARFKLRAKSNGINTMKSKYPQKVASTKINDSDSEDEVRGGKSSHNKSIQTSNSMAKKRIMSRSANFLDEYKKSKKKKKI
ncbi:hypothetical protein NADFUDRAFT_78058 [Nadsonia fulvescens var. elongata DSM 6958]|uniref:Uncharacterized protein n=1 Tax=Nadsonia fulvescens var. elongata DSM 6958 TaxID=857566 RepID=A0A1E3PMM3_9ASCO|nr:hypothetical protein NADFUDRAFT_78058 [Nadsonia fulvescens var. elongata DSM 6958]